MKTILLTILLSIIGTSSAQKTPCGDSIGHWYLEQGNTSITLKYKCDSTNKVIDFIKTLGHIENISISGPLTFDIKGLKVNYKKYGYAPRQVIQIQSPMDCKCLLKLSDSGYSILFKDFVWHEKIPVPYQIVDRDTYLNDIYFNNDGCLKKVFLTKITNTLKVTEQYLQDYLQIK